MPLNSGTKALGADKYEGSMAAAMEQTFKEEWPFVMGNSDIPATSEQLNLMFRAVANGVIRHLKENKESIKVSVTINIGTNNYTGTGTVTDIEIV